MSTEWLVTMKPTFQTEWLALPAKEAHQVLEKINLLTQDPTPDAKVKKQLKYMNGKLHRMRSGSYRIFYTFEKPYISLLALRRRDDDTYDEDFDATFLGGFDPQFSSSSPASPPASPDWEKLFAPQQPQGRPLPEPITVELLDNLHVPAQYHRRLLPLKTQEDVLSCPGVEDEMLLQIDAYMFERPLVQVLQQPDYIVNDVDDLLRYKEGELLAFLLQLSPEQEKYVRWPLNASGPTLVKGGPGTGKSTVALYRTRALLEQLLKANKESKGGSGPNLLFTTYTNALVKSSEQLLEQLLGDNAQHVRVDTADKLAYAILREQGQVKEIIEGSELNKLLRQAITETPLEGNLLQQQAQKQTLERMGLDYLLQEVTRVIVARQLESLFDYQATPRSGRKVRLNASQRAVVWRVYQRWRELVQASGKETWQQRRARAAQLVAQSSLSHSFDAVIIDEAQDLDPSLLRLLVGLCKTTQRIFVTADANQSIYGSGFTWVDVHQDLKFQGRTSILRANYRSTREIGEAAQAYLFRGGTLESEAIERAYVNSGPLPDARAVLSREDEASLLASFFKKATTSLRLAIGSCAILCPEERTGQAIVAHLAQLGLEATYMKGQELNLKRSGIKVLTLKSSKGLEFPIVALAGFVDSNYPILPYSASSDERDELLARERRTLFVGMTRAMRALLVIIPAGTESPLFQGFDQNFWSLNRKI